MNMHYNKHYIKVDSSGRIVGAFSDAFHQPDEDAVCINDKGGYQFRLFPGGEENPTLYQWPHRVPLYKYEDGEIIRRTEEEIQKDIDALPKPEVGPTKLEQMEAKLTYMAIMTDTLLVEDSPVAIAMFDDINKWYKQHLWTLIMVKNAVETNIIAIDEFTMITGEVYL